MIKKLMMMFVATMAAMGAWSATWTDSKTGDSRPPTVEFRFILTSGNVYGDDVTVDDYLLGVDD